MMKPALLISALFIFPLLTLGQAKHATIEQSPYVNYEYKGVVPDTTLPNGVKHFGGGLIGDINADPVYGISQVQKGKLKMLWLEVSTGKDASGITGWKVIDVLAFPALTKSDYLFFYGDPAIGCTRAGKDIPNLVGVGKIIRRQGFRPAKLWVADLTTKKFKPLSVSGIKCEYSEP
jgi:hypothetical protein